jgi:hypothetical protein
MIMTGVGMQAPDLGSILLKEKLWEKLVMK